MALLKIINIINFNIMFKKYYTLIVCLGLLVAKTYSKERYFTQEFGSSTNDAYGYIAFMQKEGTEKGTYRLNKLEFNGKLTEGPLVKWAMAPIALNDNIIIPCTSGDVHVFSGDLKDQWFFTIKNQRNIGIASRVDVNSTIALFTVDVTTGQKFIEVYQINSDEKSAQSLHIEEVDFVGDLIKSSNGLWLISKESAKKLSLPK